VSEFLIVF